MVRRIVAMMVAVAVVVGLTFIFPAHLAEAKQVPKLGLPKGREIIVPIPIPPRQIIIITPLPPAPKNPVCIPKKNIHCPN